MTVAAAVQGTAIVVAMDMTGGIIDRFRTMAIARSAVLTGQVDIAGEVQPVELDLERRPLERHRHLILVALGLAQRTELGIDARGRGLVRVDVVRWDEWMFNRAR